MTSGDAPAEFGAFLDVHRMILDDPTLAEAPKRMIAEQHCNAEWALTQQMDVLVAQFEPDRGPLPARAQGRRRAGGRARAEGPAGQAARRAVRASAEEQTILVAHDLSPADVIQFKQPQFAAFLTDLGGVTSHTAIVARSLNVPAVVGAHNGRGADPRERAGDRRRRARRRHRQPRRVGARRVPAEAGRDRARAAEAQAAQDHARGHARRRGGRAARQHRAARRRRAGAARTAPPASACSAASSCS